MSRKKVSKKSRTRGATKRREPLPVGKWFKTGLKASAVLVAVAVTGMIASLLSDLDWQPAPVKRVELTDELIYQSKSQFDAVTDVFLQRNLFLLDVDEVRKTVEQLPWVFQASVRKQWPGVLVVSVEEHQPVAFWNDTEVLNSDGEPLENPELDLQLARLLGPENGEMVVMEQYLRFAQIFADQGTGLEQVKMYPRGAWELQLENGILISLGDRNVVERSRRVVRVLNLEAYRDKEIEYIDARYSNGIAIKTAS